MHKIVLIPSHIFDILDSCLTVGVAKLSEHSISCKNLSITIENLSVAIENPFW